VLNALALQRETEALLVGEPTGGKPNHFGEVQQFHLPHSQLKVFYSTKYFEASEQDNDSLMPDISAPATFSEYLHGVDPAIMAILDYAQS
jgi:C-terminal processing protease CtpA/Prc